MAIFATLQTDRIVQVGDKTRLDASHSFVAGADVISMIEIQPSDADIYIQVPLDQPYLDWVYSTAGDVVVAVRVTVSSGDSTSASVGTADLAVLSAETDALFSSDSDLVAQEPSIRDLLPRGRSTFLNVHREAQELIMDAVNRKVSSASQNWLTPISVVDKREVREWSKYLTLHLIFEGSINTKDDVFYIKSSKYKGLADNASERSYIALDLNGDGTLTDDEKKTGFTSVGIVRR